MNREKFVKKVIWPAIWGQSCPICLEDLEPRRAAVLTGCSHAYCVECIRKWSDLRRKCPLCNADFDSWFCKISLSTRTFFKERLRTSNYLTRKGDVDVGLSSRRVGHRRLLERTQNESNSISRRTRPLPWRRSFGQPGSVPPDVIAERKLQWRASIYGRHLQAVPSPPQSGIGQFQNLASNTGLRERIVQRIEPWIWREVQAVLGDPDPSVIVHVATSTFIASLERKNYVHSEQLCVEDDLIMPLRPFLHDRTNLFWHELRCFAESTLNMETYDSVVEYEQLG